MGTLSDLFAPTHLQVVTHDDHLLDPLIGFDLVPVNRSVVKSSTTNATNEHE
jgi:hypothetical protein